MTEASAALAPDLAASQTQILEHMEGRMTEQINPTAYASSPTQEDWYWGRMATGSEEDYYWRRLSDNFYQKDVIPSTYLELHNQCFEAYNANPLAFAIIELTTSFVLGIGRLLGACCMVNKSCGMVSSVSCCIDASFRLQVIPQVCRNVGGKGNGKNSELSAFLFRVGENKQ
jgi:hypothetical protein